MAGHGNPDYNTLDIPELQALTEFPGDANGLNHHHRVLFYRVRDARWIVGSPDWDVYVEDQAEHNITALRRNAPFPARLVAEVYAFDRQEARDRMAQARADAKALAVIMGCSENGSANAAQGGGSQGDWRIADVDHERFGEIILEGDMADEDSNAELEVDDERRRLHFVDGEILVLDYVEDYASWADSKRPGVPGGHAGDLRLLGCERNSQGKRFLTLKRAMEMMTKHSFKDWPHKGPGSLYELLEGIAETLGDIDLYFLNFIRKSGVGENIACVHEMKNLLLVLKLNLGYDQCDYPNLASMEQVGRRILEIQTAIRRNPRHPVFDSMETTATSFVDEIGGARASSYSDWLTEQQRGEAKRMKAVREFREETTADKKQRANENSADPKRKGGGKGKKGKTEEEAP